MKSQGCSFIAETPFLSWVMRYRAWNHTVSASSVESKMVWSLALAGLKEGDLLNVAADGTRIVITPQEVRERGAGYTMTDLLGAASGVYGSVEEIDAEIAGGRAE